MMLRRSPHLAPAHRREDGQRPAQLSVCGQCPRSGAAADRLALRLAPVYRLRHHRREQDPQRALRRTDSQERGRPAARDGLSAPSRTPARSQLRTPGCRRSRASIFTTHTRLMLEMTRLRRVGPSQPPRGHAELPTFPVARYPLRQASLVMCEPPCGPICNIPPSTTQEAPVT